MSKIDIEKNIIEKIKKDEIKMKPRYYFVFGSLFITLGMMVSFIFSAFFINLISHRIRMLKMAEYLPMGAPGRIMFIQRFPWHFLFIALALIALGAWLLKMYDISYRKSFLAILVGIFITVVCAGLVVDKLGINGPLQKKPGFRELYNMPPNNMPPQVIPGIRGTIPSERSTPPRMYYK